MPTLPHAVRDSPFQAKPSVGCMAALPQSVPRQMYWLTMSAPNVPSISLSALAVLAITAASAAIIYFVVFIIEMYC